MVASMRLGDGSLSCSALHEQIEKHSVVSQLELPNPNNPPPEFCFMVRANPMDASGGTSLNNPMQALEFYNKFGPIVLYNFSKSFNFSF